MLRLARILATRCHSHVQPKEAPINSASAQAALPAHGRDVLQLQQRDTYRIPREMDHAAYRPAGDDVATIWLAQHSPRAVLQVQPEGARSIEGKAESLVVVA